MKITPVLTPIELLADAGQEIVSLSIEKDLRKMKISHYQVKKILRIVHAEVEHRYPTKQVDMLGRINDTIQRTYDRWKAVQK